MKILVDIPMDDYNNLLQRCDVSRPEYEMLKNGVITRDGKERASVEILCAPEDAKMILDFATQIYPHAAPHVQESIILARQPRSIPARVS